MAPLAVEVLGRALALRVALLAVEGVLAPELLELLLRVLLGLVGDVCCMSRSAGQSSRQYDLQ